jgi:hypothetical protein
MVRSPWKSYAFIKPNRKTTENYRLDTVLAAVWRNGRASFAVHRNYFHYGLECDTMSKRSTDPYHALKRLRHHFLMLELKYNYAKEAGRSIICDRLAKKAAHIQERIQEARAVIQVMFRRDWDEAVEMNEARNAVNKLADALIAATKENKDGMVHSDTDNRESN